MMSRGLWRKFNRDWGWNLARLLAYTLLQGLFAILGLELIVLALVLRLLSPASEAGFESQMLRFLPAGAASNAAAAFEHSLRHAPIWVLLLGLPIALWYGSRFFVVLESCLCVIFRRRQRPLKQQNGMALAMLGLFALLLPVIVLATTLTPSLGTNPGAHALGVARLSSDPALAALALLAGFAANFALLLVAYTTVTPRSVTFQAAWPGALLGAVLAQLYLLIFPFYVRHVLHPDHFGTVAGFVLVVLVFFYAYSLCIVIGAELTAWRTGLRPDERDVATILAHDHLATTAPRHKVPPHPSLDEEPWIALPSTLPAPHIPTKSPFDIPVASLDTRIPD